MSGSHIWSRSLRVVASSDRDLRAVATSGQGSACGSLCLPIVASSLPLLHLVWHHLSLTLTLSSHGCGVAGLVVRGNYVVCQPGSMVRLLAGATELLDSSFSVASLRTVSGASSIPARPRASIPSLVAIFCFLIRLLETDRLYFFEKGTGFH